MSAPPKTETRTLLDRAALELKLGKRCIFHDPNPQPTACTFCRHRWLIQELLTDLATLTAERDRLTQQNAKLKAFARQMLNGYIDSEPGDIDGAWLEDTAFEWGLLEHRGGDTRLCFVADWLSEDGGRAK